MGVAILFSSVGLTQARLNSWLVVVHEPEGQSAQMLGVRLIMIFEKVC